MAFTKIFVEGNVGRDPEMRYTPNGRPVTQFSVAVNNSKKNAAGEWEDDGTDWYRVTVWGDGAERAAERVKKGQRVMVVGRFRSREFEDKDHNKRVALEITADNGGIIEMGAREGSGGSSFNSAEFNSYASTPPGQTAQPVQSGRGAPDAPFVFRGRDDDLDDLPF